jgi:glycosyltransferase EpsJ
MGKEEQIDTPKASVVVPCWNSAPWLDDALDSVLAAADRIKPCRVEVICADDGSEDATPAILAERAGADPRIRVLSLPHKGVSAARNAALAAAAGEYVFFLDPDDTVQPDWLADGVAAMDETRADWCIAPFRIRDGDDTPFRILPLKDDYRLDGNDAIVSQCVSRLIGYSFDDLRRWFAGDELFAPRELGSVCRCVFRRELIERHNVRFDETVGLGEDAFFNCEYLLHASRTTVLDRALYDYTVRTSGATMRLNASPSRVENKFRLLALRRRLDEISGGRLAPLYAASCVLAPLEILGTFRKSGVGLPGALRAARKYLRDETAARALRECPLSWHRPLFSAGVLFLKAIA